MEEVEELEENEILGGQEESCHRKNDIDETAEDLMTDMRLEDEIDEVRAIEPDFNWTYHIEVYPWNADDMTENFVRIIKLAQFSQIYMRKKGVGKETDDSEKIDDKLPARQRKGCLHLYTDTSQNAKNIMRSSTWKTMTAKELTFEITKRGPNDGETESAYLELDTYSASKSRFRDKPKGELKDRSAKVSNLPGTISREFLDVVFSRAYAVIGGTTVREYLKEKEGRLHEKLHELKDFNGSLDFDCLGRGSCRAFVLAHKNVYIGSQRISIEANDKETMVVPPFTHDAGAVKKIEKDGIASVSQPGKGRGTMPVRDTPFPARGLRTGFNSSGWGFSKDVPINAGRGRGIGRAMMPQQRPATAPFTRPGPGMPIPMTGRQKMNEKMRRSNFGMTPGSNSLFAMPGNVLGTRGAAINSVGDSFKQEIASLQNQLERSTQVLEAKIALLQQTTQSAAFYDEDVNVFEPGDWGDAEYNTGYSHENYSVDNGRYCNDNLMSFHFNNATSIRPRRSLAGAYAGSEPNMGQVTGQKPQMGPSRGSPSMRRGEPRGGVRRGRGQMRGSSQTYW